MSHSKRMHVSKLSLALVMALAAAPAFAQTTSAGVNGVIVGTDGRPVANQVVTITHTETNTSTRVTTDASGRYAASGPARRRPVYGVHHRRFRNRHLPVGLE